MRDSTIAVMGGLFGGSLALVCNLSWKQSLGTTGLCIAILWFIITLTRWGFS